MTTLPNDPIVAFVEFTDGHTRPVYEDLSGNQYIVNGCGEHVFGV